MTELSAHDVVVRKGGREILRSVSLDARAGDFIAIIGPNGAGKSTFLAVLAGLTRPDTGTVMIDRRPLASYSSTELARRRAFLPQNARCEWPISVERLVALGLTPTLPAFGSLAAADAEKVSTALQACDLLDHREQPATTLSGGELARAMLARALVGDPDILLIDEPMAGLDPRHALETASRLERFAARGKLVIAPIHDLTVAARYATRIFALHDGRVVADGLTQQTLTPKLLQTTFEVSACISGSGKQAFVDFLKLPDRS